MKNFIGVLACLGIVAMDLTAGILGIKAEAAQSQDKNWEPWMPECKRPSHEAFVLGIAAATLLGTAHALANLLGGCSFCTREQIRNASPTKQLSIACLVFTWIILTIGLSMLVIGIIWNHKAQASCAFGHHRFLWMGGIFCMVHAMVSVGYYVTSTSALL